MHYIISHSVLDCYNFQLLLPLDKDLCILWNIFSTDGTMCRISRPKKNSNEFHYSTTGLQMMPTAHHFDPTIELQTAPINYIPIAPLPHLIPSTPF